MLKHQRWVVHTAWEASDGADDTEVELAIVSAMENLGTLEQFELELDDEWFEGDFDVKEIEG